MAANITEMNFGKVYDCLVKKAEKKGRSKVEVDEIITWLTGYKQAAIDELAASEKTYGDFYKKAPKLNPNRELIKGKICGVQVETIEDPFMKFVRQLDKQIDELAKGRTMDKILRAPANIDEYLATTGDKQQILSEIRDMLRSVMPDATERIAFGMPTYWKNHNLIHFAAMKAHLGIYPGAEGTAHFADRLDAEGYKYSKGAIQFPWKREIPMDLIREIAEWCRDNNS